MVEIGMAVNESRLLAFVEHVTIESITNLSDFFGSGLKVFDINGLQITEFLTGSNLILHQNLLSTRFHRQLT